MSLSPSRIVELATTVAQHTQQIDSYLAEKGLPYPSFEANGPADLSLPPHIEQSRTVALQASQELNDLLQGPRDLLFNHEVRLSTNDGAQIAANATIAQCVGVSETNFALRYCKQSAYGWRDHIHGFGSYYWY